MNNLGKHCFVHIAGESLTKNRRERVHDFTILEHIIIGNELVQFFNDRNATKFFMEKN